MVEQQYLILSFANGIRMWRIATGEKEHAYWERDENTLWVSPWPLIVTETGQEVPMCGG